MKHSETPSDQSGSDEIDRDWEREKIQYMIGGCGRFRYVPGKLSIAAGSLVIIAFGLLLLTSFKSSKPALKGASRAS